MPDAENYYYIAVASTRPAPEGMHEYVVPACTWAVFPGRGSMPAAMQELQKRVVSEWLPGSGYEWGQAPDLEVYLDDGLSGESSFEDVYKRQVFTSVLFIFYYLQGGWLRGRIRKMGYAPEERGRKKEAGAH